MNKLRIAYNSNGVRLLPLNFAARELKELGYQGLELSLDHCHLHPWSGPVQAFTMAKRNLNRLGMPVCAVHTGAKYALGDVEFEPSLVSRETEGRQKRLDFILAAVDMAALLGAPVCTVTSGFKPGTVSDDAAEELLLEALETICAYAGGRVKICIEPEPGMFVGSLGKALAMRNELGGRLSLTLDVGHAFCNGEDYLDVIFNNPEAIGHIHIEDIAGRVHQHLIPGTGDIDFPPFFSAIQEIDYRGFVSVELYTYNDKPIEAARESMVYLRRILAKGRG